MAGVLYVLTSWMSVQPERVARVWVRDRLRSLVAVSEPLSHTHSLELVG
jgi:hypothetical protein